LFVLTLGVLVGCDSGKNWENDQYAVIWTDTKDNASLYRKNKSGDPSIHRIGPEVKKIYLDERYIVARIEEIGTEISFYYILNIDRDSNIARLSDVVSGPFSSEKDIQDSFSEIQLWQMKSFQF